LFEGFTE